MKENKLYRVSAETEEKILDKIKKDLHQPNHAKTDLTINKFHFSVAYTDETDLQEKIKQSLENYSTQKFQPSPPGKLCILFTGQGSQYPGMAKTLYEQNSLVRNALNNYSKLLQSYNQQDYLSQLITESNSINQTQFTQPCIVMLQMALHELWEKAGIKSDIYIGHSVGEYSATACIGYYSKSNILQLIAQRATLMQSIDVEGGMIAVCSSQDDINSIMNKTGITLDYAAFNAPNQIVLSGSMVDIKKMMMQCTEQKIKARILTVSHPFHSRLMTPITEPFKNFSASIEAESKQNAAILISNLTGTALSQPQSADYWSKHILQPVYYEQSIKQAWDMGARVFLEVGPDAILSKLARKCLRDKDAMILSSLSRNKNAPACILECAVSLENIGYAVNYEVIQNISHTAHA